MVREVYQPLAAKCAAEASADCTASTAPDEEINEMAV
jgi:hypothetical protein